MCTLGVLCVFLFKCGVFQVRLSNLPHLFIMVPRAPCQADQSAAGAEGAIGKAEVEDKCHLCIANLGLLGLISIVF